MSQRKFYFNCKSIIDGVALIWDLAALPYAYKLEAGSAAANKTRCRTEQASKQQK